MQYLEYQIVCEVKKFKQTTLIIICVFIQYGNQKKKKFNNNYGYETILWSKRV